MRKRRGSIFIYRPTRLVESMRLVKSYEKGLLDDDKDLLEALVSLKRAGSNFILS